jgi:hypothetical protein
MRSRSATSRSARRPPAGSSPPRHLSPGPSSVSGGDLGRRAQHDLGLQRAGRFAAPAASPARGSTARARRGRCRPEPPRRAVGRSRRRSAAPCPDISQSGRTTPSAAAPAGRAPRAPPARRPGRVGPQRARHVPVTGTPDSSAGPETRQPVGRQRHGQTLGPSARPGTSVSEAKPVTTARAVRPSSARVAGSRGARAACGTPCAARPARRRSGRASCPRRGRCRRAARQAGSGHRTAPRPCTSKAASAPARAGVRHDHRRARHVHRAAARRRERPGIEPHDEPVVVSSSTPPRPGSAARRAGAHHRLSSDICSARLGAAPGPRAMRNRRPRKWPSI